ncbi:MAG TPA: sigma-70 family RNA polymerase sigma factor, partial [Solirubrobacteraceae bacterium]|nr:sigma-70 family RNA polymerase sigma factor [Solirubrobacteraceae bacterium]
MGAPAPRPPGRSDHELVSAVRRGDDRAFEALYGRYQRRITAYVEGMVKDSARAEDITQEVFVSALRRMRATHRPITFKPWLYEIAKNACIDAYRRSRRAEEISYDAEGGLAPADYGRLVAVGAGPVEAIGSKQQLEHLTGAFGGLSDTHHEILVLREFEGRSYADIGERLGMTRPAVESTLFRARKRLGEEYEALASGRRCQEVQGLVLDGAVPGLGARDRRKVARHFAHCQSCRRLAALTGVEIPAALPKRAADKLRSLLPIPVWFGRGGGGGADLAAVAQLSAGSGEPLVQAWSKALAALVAVALAGAGVGVQPPGRTKQEAAIAATYD